MHVRKEIIDLIKDYAHQNIVITPHTCLEKDCHILMDDFHELVDIYAKQFNVNMDNYLWYFHAEEEGTNISKYFYKPPYDRVDRISITPLILEQFAQAREWNIEYPPHNLPKHRYDLIINFIFITIPLLFALFILAYQMLMS